MIRNPRCPKCGSGHLILRELTEGWAEWELVDDTFPDGHAYLNPGAVRGVYAECYDCEHSWKLKGVLHIGQVPAYNSIPS